MKQKISKSSCRHQIGFLNRMNDSVSLVSTFKRCLDGIHGFPVILVSCIENKIRGKDCDRRNILREFLQSDILFTELM